MFLSNLKISNIAICFAVVFLVNFSARALDYTNNDVSTPITSSTSYTNATIANSRTLSSGSLLGGYVYLGGTIDGDISFSNSGSITSTHSNYGVFYSPSIGNTSSLKSTSITNTGSLITTGDFAIPIYILGKVDGSVRRSFAFSLNNSSDGEINSTNNGVYIVNGSLGTFAVTNAGTISTSSTSSSHSAINLSGGSTATITNSGEITAGGSAKAITIGTSSATITNNIGGTITGAVALGSNAGSSLVLNGGTVNGNITMANAAQVLTLNGGTLTGTVNGAGTINVTANSVTNGHIGASTSLTSLTIAATKTLDAATNNNSIRATNILLGSGSVLSMGDGTLTGTVNATTASQGTVNITLSANADVIANLGSSTSLAAVNFVAVDSAMITAKATISATQVSISGVDGSLTLDTSVGINGDVEIGQNSNLLMSNGSFVAGIISSATSGSGVLQLNGGNFTTNFAIGTASRNLGNITVMDDTTLTTNAALRSSTISISSNAVLNSSSVITGALDLSTNATLNLQDGATLNGSIDPGGIIGEGIVNSSGAVTILAEIGNMGAIKEINISSGSQLRIGNNDGSHTNSISSVNTNITGQLDLIDATTINSDVTMIGSSSKIDLSGYSHSINGSFTTASGSRLYSTIHNSSTADKLTISGAATINSNTKLSLTVGAVTLGSSYTIIDGGSGSSLNAITNANIDVNDSGKNRFGRYIFTSTTSGDDIIVNTTLLNFRANNSNQNSAFNIIADANAGNSGSLSRLQDYIYDTSISDAAKNEAINSALPQIDNSNNRIIFNNAGTSFDLSSSRLAMLYNADNKIQLSANLNQKNPLTKSDFNHGLYSAKNNYDNAIWSQVFGSNIKQGNNSISEGYDANSRGVIFGFDKKVDKDSYLGISGSYTNSDAKSRGKLKSTTIDSYQINIYHGKIFEKYFINNLIGFAWNEYKSTRAIPTAGTVAKAQYSGQNYIARIEGGSNFKLPQDYILIPSAMITAAHNAVDNYNENGADTLNLRVKTASSNFFETRLGATVKKHFSINNLNIDPEIFASYGYDFAGAKQRTSSNFIGQSTTFDSTSSNLARGSFKSGFAATIYQKEAISFNLNYTFEKRVNYQANSVGVKGLYRF